MLINPTKHAAHHYSDFTDRDIQVIADAALRAAQVAASIARDMGRVDVANEILRRAMEP